MSEAPMTPVPVTATNKDFTMEVSLNAETSSQSVLSGYFFFFFFFYFLFFFFFFFPSIFLILTIIIFSFRVHSYGRGI